MVSQTFTITNSQGFHMRPAGAFTAAMGKYQSTVTVIKDGNRIDGKSIMNLIAACIKCGTEITIEIDGADEATAMKEAAEMIENGFGE
ncbi:MAG: HPr family phosphocarrier protein [Oscillospiraceae bacterium]|nr:HPr family phosphocarrier protein [Oscillospiraceae bacterium]